MTEKDITNMSLKEALSNEKRPNNFGCSVKHIRNEMSKEDAEFFDSALKDENITSASLVRAMKTEGYAISIHSMGRHRRGDCNCRLKNL